jgi:glycosyltransferase involved in cell wall biosynthesis
MLFFCAAPRISSTDQSGAGSHIRGVVGGFRDLGWTTELMLAGDRTTETGRVDRVVAKSAPVGAGQPVGELENGAMTTAPRGRGLRARTRERLPRAWASARALSSATREIAHAASLRRRLHLEPPALVYERMGEWQCLSTALSKRQRIPHVVEVNSFPGAESTIEPRLLRWVRSRSAAHLLRRATAVVVVSSVLHDQLQSSFTGLPPILVLPNAAPPIATHSPTTPRANIVFAGSMRAWHRLDLLIAAVALANHRLDPEVKVVVAGIGPEYEATRRGIIESQVQDRFSLVGQLPQSELFEVYSTAAVGVLPANPDYGSPTKLLEYAAHGLAIVGPDATGVRDLFVNGRNALLVPPDASALANALCDAMQEQRRGVLAEEALTLARSWTWTEVVTRLLAALPCIEDS